MTTKLDLIGRERKRGRSRDGGGKVRKPQQGLWACAGVKGICPMKPHARIGSPVHGTKEEAMRCNQKALEAAAGGIE